MLFSANGAEGAVAAAVVPAKLGAPPAMVAATETSFQGVVTLFASVACMFVNVPTMTPTSKSAIN